MEFPFARAVAVTPSNSTDFPNLPEDFPDAIYIGGAGVVAVVMPDLSVVNFTCVAGQTLRVKARRVNSTNTTATLMVACYY